MKLRKTLQHTAQVLTVPARSRKPLSTRTGDGKVAQPRTTVESKFDNL